MRFRCQMLADRARDAVRDASKGADPATGEKTGQAGQDDWRPRHRLDRAVRQEAAKAQLEGGRLHPAGRGVAGNGSKRAIEDIKRRDVRMLVEAIADRGAPIMANRTTALLSKLFKFALDDELIEASPAVKISRPGAEQKRDRVLSDE